MATAALKFAKDAKGDITFAPLPTTTMYSAELTTGSPDSITLALLAEFYTVSFVYEPGTACWVDVTGVTAAVPAGATFATTTSRLNPASYLLPAGTVISMITGNATAQVSIAIWQGGNT
jgi:hypothetical protein